ncbi:MAG: penicillin-binding protein 2 [Chloroflexi bacterium]|nr:penicillin-binding protein 2 [Chloroflexota bacterium]
MHSSRRTFLKNVGLTLLSVGLGNWLVACDSEPQATPNLSTPTASGPLSELGDDPTSVQGNTPDITPPAVSPTPEPSGSSKPNETAQAFLKAWEEKRYSAMYALLTTTMKTSISTEKFVARYNAIAEEATITELMTNLNLVAPPPGKDALGYQLPFDVTMKTARVGDIKFQNTMVLRPEGSQWLVDWSPALIFPQLNSVNLIHMFGNNAPRGDIRDSAGQPLAVLNQVSSVFVVPGRIENEGQLLTVLSQELKLDQPKIKALYVNGRPDWLMPIKDLPPGTKQEVIDRLLKIAGVGVNDKTVRGYPAAATTAHVVGYLGAVNDEDLKTLAIKGYKQDDLIGRTGLEAWAEETLVGVKGGKLVITSPEGTPIITLAERASQPASNLFLTLDLKIQKAAEAALAGRNGSIVVMNPADGAILALVSQPSFDPNTFIQGLTAQQYKALSDDLRRPFLNRPINGTFPTGSIFKVITASAALDRAGLTMDTRFTCTGHWEGLGAKFAKDCYLKTGHGNITLYEGLVQSCDIVFYELGKKLDEINPNLLPGFTKACGLGASCGLVGLNDSPGQVPDGKWKEDNIKQSWFSGDAVNLAIGQGYLLASPLQMAGVYAGIANGGSVPVPHLIARTEKGGNATPVAPKERLLLPVNPIHLGNIRRALLDVTQNPRGTAQAAFAGSKVKVAGKTGTAESGKTAPHAWFACYAPAERPKYVVVVMLEEIGEGGSYAAPAARKLIDTLSF